MLWKTCVSIHSGAGRHRGLYPQFPVVPMGPIPFNYKNKEASLLQPSSANWESKVSLNEYHEGFWAGEDGVCNTNFFASVLLVQSTEILISVSMFTVQKQFLRRNCFCRWKHGRQSTFKGILFQSSLQSSHHIIKYCTLLYLWVVLKNQAASLLSLDIVFPPSSYCVHCVLTMQHEKMYTLWSL